LDAAVFLAHPPVLEPKHQRAASMRLVDLAAGHYHSTKLVFILELVFILPCIHNKLIFILKLVFILNPVFILKLIFSPYVHVVYVLLTTAGCGISQDHGERSYGVRISLGATGLPDFSTSTQKEEGGDRKDGLNKADNAALARGGELPIRPPQVSTQGGP
jgi:hypothetical protein